MILQIRCATNKPSARKNKCNYVFILKSKFCFNLFTLRLESLCHFKDCLPKLKCIYNNWRYLLFNIGMLSHTFGLVEECYFFAVYYGAWFEVFCLLALTRYEGGNKSKNLKESATICCKKLYSTVSLFLLMKQHLTCKFNKCKIASPSSAPI